MRWPECYRRHALRKKTKNVLEQTRSIGALKMRPELKQKVTWAQRSFLPTPAPRKSQSGTRNYTRGDPCPGCEKGKVYPQKEPRMLVRVVGQAPLAATVYELDRLRCNRVRRSVHRSGTGRHRPGKIRRDHRRHDRFAQVRQRNAVLSFQKKLEQALGIPLPASTQWEIM